MICITMAKSTYKKHINNISKRYYKGRSYITDICVYYYKLCPPLLAKGTRNHMIKRLYIHELLSHKYHTGIYESLLYSRPPDGKLLNHPSSYFFHMNDYDCDRSERFPLCLWWNRRIDSFSSSNIPEHTIKILIHEYNCFKATRLYVLLKYNTINPINTYIYEMDGSIDGRIDK